MIIKRACFDNFRNLKDCEIVPCEHIHIICGNNAQGKTNILEAIWLFSGFRSFRGSKDNELISFDSEFFSDSLEFYAFDRVQTARMSVSRQQRRIILNDVPLKLTSELIGSFCCVVFSPSYLSLVKGGPNERRRFIDTAICQITPSYAGVMKKFTRLLDQRNYLIKEIKRGRAQVSELDVWDEQLCEAEAKIANERIFYINEIAQYVNEIHSGLSGQSENIELRYLTRVGKYFKETVEISQEEILRNLKNNVDKDLFNGMTMTGVHHDEIDITVNGRNIKKFGSQGQQRSAVLALKLAEAEKLRDISGEEPVILLDDVMSELDERRQDYILNHIADRQVFITCCDPSTVPRLNTGYVFRVENGNVSRETVV